MQLGFNLLPDESIAEAEAYAVQHGFELIQLWFDHRGLMVQGRAVEDVGPLRDCAIKTVVHAVLTPNELVRRAGDVASLARKAGHSWVILHPISGRGECRDGRTRDLVAALRQRLPVFTDAGLRVCVENNCALHPMVHTTEDLTMLVEALPEVELLLDIAHMDGPAHLESLVSVRFPYALHVADRHLAVAHEHLAIGEGDIDINALMSTTLKGFDGPAVFEMPDTAARQASRRAFGRALARR